MPTPEKRRKRHIGLGVVLGVLCALGFIAMGVTGAYVRTAAVVCKPGYMPTMAMSGIICAQGYRP